MHAWCLRRGHHPGRNPGDPAGWLPYEADAAERGRHRVVPCAAIVGAAGVYGGAVGGGMCGCAAGRGHHCLHRVSSVSCGTSQICKLYKLTCVIDINLSGKEIKDLIKVYSR